MKKYAGFLFLILTGCSSSQLTTSIPEKELKQNQFSQYDPDSNIQYMVSNDQDNLHIKFKTADQSSIMKIMKQGTQVYFDTRGKKKKKVFLEYPLAQEVSGMRPDRSQSEKMVPGERTRPDMNKLLEAVPQEAIFTNHDESEIIQFSLLETDIKPSLELSGKSEITYDLIIPFHRLAEGGLASIDILSVGIVTESPKMQTQGGGQGGGMGGPGGGGMGGGGMGGPGGGGGMGGGMGGRGGQGGGMGGSGSGSGQNMMDSPIEIWFNVDLNRE